MRPALRIPQIVLLALGLAAGVAAKWQSADGHVAGWLLAAGMAGLVVAWALEAVEKLLRRRTG